MQATIARVTVVLLLALMGVATVMIAPGDDRAVFSAQPEPPITVIALTPWSSSLSRSRSSPARRCWSSTRAR